MKTCSYCGHETSGDAAFCPGCGTEFIEPPKELPGGPFRRPPRPEAASIVFRTFSQELPAERAASTLRAAQIEAYIATDDCGGLFPALSGDAPFRLIISEVHWQAAEQVLADAEGRTAVPVRESVPGIKPAKPMDSSPPSDLRGKIRSLVVFALGIVAGVLALLGYQRIQETFSGTVERDFNSDGRTDGWDTYVKGQYSRVATDHNGDEQPDVWYYYEDGMTTKWEEDFNFDGKIDIWGTYDGRQLPSQSKEDRDFDGKPDVTHFFQFGLLKESHYILPILPDSGLVWKKCFYTNGLLREELLDRNRDGKFDERLFFDVYGVEVNKEKLK